MENIKAGSECSKGAGYILSPPHKPNQHPTTSRASTPTRPVSDWMQFSNNTLWNSGEAAVAGSGLGQPLVSSPRNRPLEKADEDGRGDLGG